MIPCSEDAAETICVAPDTIERECPVTDVKIINKSDFDKELYKEYTRAEVNSGDDLSWMLLYSKTFASLPISRFELTEEAPCTLDDTFVRSQSSNQNLNFAKDKFATKCPIAPLDP